uniref:uncharacterized protein LOC105351582 n=1 Tax=Fragaria vesca subsp. vesca TaxID=101020 RepID=UPI0005C83377|nr:PREDICTED: uncharacterized protein LOC105351582 [Fragaria vesca subsp. vesca]
MTGQVACMADKDLPASGGCGVFGSKIVFASGHKASDCLPCPDCSTQVYGYDIHDPKQEIVKMEGAFGTLNDGKEQPLVVEFAGKLYVLSLKDFVKGGVSFEVFDPNRVLGRLCQCILIVGLRYSYAIPTPNYLCLAEPAAIVRDRFTALTSPRPTTTRNGGESGQNTATARTQLLRWTCPSQNTATKSYSLPLTGFVPV